MKKTWMISLAALVCTTTLAYSQIAQEMSAERHHTPVFENGKVRVFAVTLPRAEQAFVRHDHNYVMVTLNDLRTGDLVRRTVRHP